MVSCAILKTTDQDSHPGSRLKHHVYSKNKGRCKHEAYLM